MESRIVESMNNNKHFYGFFLRYTDLDTLCFRLNEGRNYKYPGMGVDILPLRGNSVPDSLICGQEPRKWDGMSWLIIMETEKAGKGNLPFCHEASPGHRTCRLGKAFTACSVKG